MKRVSAIALVLVLSVSMLAGCRRRNDETDTTGMDTTGAYNTEATNRNTTPIIEDIVPDTNDTVSPTNGANQTDHTNGTNGTDGTIDNTGRSRNFPMH